MNFPEDFRFRHVAEDIVFDAFYKHGECFVMWKYSPEGRVQHVEYTQAEAEEYFADGSWILVEDE